jgi:hypothetical protein
MSVLALERVVFVIMFLLSLEKAVFRNGCGPRCRWKDRRVAAMEIAKTDCVAVMKAAKIM